MLRRVRRIVMPVTAAAALTALAFVPTNPADAAQAHPNPAAAGDSMITNVASGRCLDVPGATHNSQVQIIQYGCHGRSNQQWVFTPNSHGGYLIRNANSGKCLDVFGDHKNNGTNVIQATCHGRANQRWQVDWVDRDRFVLRSTSSKKCLDVTGASHADGAGLIIYSCHKRVNQQFRLTAAPGAAAVRWEHQSTGYNCGPTASRIALSALLPSGRLPSAATLAHVEHTSAQTGTYRTGVQAGMNTYAGEHQWTISQGDVWSDIVNARAKGLPVLVAIEIHNAKQLPPGWASSKVGVQHWFTAYDYTTTNGGQVLIADPASTGRGFNPNGTYWIPLSTLRAIHVVHVYPKR